MDSTFLRLGLCTAVALSLSTSLSANPTDATTLLLDESTPIADILRTEKHLRDRLGDLFGNVWLDSHTGKLTVGITDPSVESVVLNAGAVPKLVQHSERALNYALGTLNKYAHTMPPEVTGWHIDYESNSIVVSTIGKSAGAQNWTRSLGLPLAKIEQVSERPQLLIDEAISDHQMAASWDLIGGLAIYNRLDGRCSHGFSGWKITEPYTLYAITAGHCTSAGGNIRYYDRQVIGPVLETHFPGKDYGLIEITNPDSRTSNLVSRYQSGGYVKHITNTQPAVFGSQVCGSGSTRGWRCGAITATNVTACPAVNQCVQNLTRARFCSYGGDSGGSVVTAGEANATVYAQGIVSMTTGGYCELGAQTLYQPIHPILNDHDIFLHWVFPGRP